MGFNGCRTKPPPWADWRRSSCLRTDRQMEVTIILCAWWVWCSDFQFPSLICGFMFSIGDSSLLETSCASASVVYVWTCLFQIPQKHCWNLQTKTPWLMASVCFISLGSCTRRLSTALRFHSWELWFATGITTRMERKPQCFLPSHMQGRC